MNIKEMIEEILTWADDNDWFDTTFIESVQDNFERYGVLTGKQKDAVQKIYYKFVEGI